MKQHHQQQLKIIGVALLLIFNYVFSFILIGCRANATHQRNVISSHIDEVYIFYLDFDLEFVTNVSKEDFMCQYVRSKEIHRVVINDSSSIEQFSNTLSSLQESIELTNANINSSFFYKPIVSESNRLYLINTYPIDIRCLLVIKDNNRYTPIWLSNNYVDLNNVYYVMSDDLRKWIIEMVRDSAL